MKDILEFNKEITIENGELEFEKIANQLIRNYQLIINDAKFNFTEIEFYYLSTDDGHLDLYTHIHDYEAGKWRFHNVGFDITIKGANGFGGILIRGVERVNKSDSEEIENFINGPRRVIFETFKHLKHVGVTENVFGLKKTKIVHGSELVVYPAFRQGLKVETMTENKINRKLKKIHGESLEEDIVSKAFGLVSFFQKAKYRFIAKRKGEIYPIIPGKEKIAKQLGNTFDKSEFLNYNKNQ